jgi:hypothetical protein
MIVRQDVSILIEIPDDCADTFEAADNWVRENLKKTSAISWSCGEMYEDGYLP